MSMEPPCVSNTLPLLSCLQDGQAYSTDTLKNKLGISDIELKELVGLLQKHGVSINSLSGQSYQLLTSFSLLDFNKLQQNITSKCVLFPVLASTNQYVIEHTQEFKHGDVCLSEMQTSGKARRGRIWQSPLAQNLYVSLYWTLNSDIRLAMGMSIVTGVVIAEALEGLGINTVQLKWPNDLYLDNKKLCGVLVEVVEQTKEHIDLVIGFGLNVNMDSVTEVGQPWTSLYKHTGQIHDRNHVTAEVVNRLHQELSHYQNVGLAPYIERWNRFDLFKGREVVVILNQHQKVSGISKGIDESGLLVLETPSGLQSFHSGEATLRRQEN